MATIDAQFYQSLFSQPGQTSPTIMDELQGSLSSDSQSIQRAAQMVSEIHGPYNGTSPELHSSITTLKESTENIGKNKKTIEEHNKKIIETLLDLQSNYNDLKA